MIRRLACAASAALALALVLPAMAQSDYPSRTVTMIVPFPPGGVADITARPAAEAMGRFLKQSVIVENRPARAVAWACRTSARAKPDGYTVMVALSSDLDHPGGGPDLRAAVPVPDLAVRSHRSLQRRPDRARRSRRQPVEVGKDLVDAARQTPGADPVRVDRATTARCTCPWRCCRRGRREVAARPVHRRRPRGRRPAGRQRRRALHRPVLDHGPREGRQGAGAGGLGRIRHPALPDVPTLRELGYDAQFSQWTGLFVPAGTPEPVIAKLRDAAGGRLRPHLPRRAREGGDAAQYLDQPQFRAFWDADAKKLADVVKKIGRVEMSGARPRASGPRPACPRGGAGASRGGRAGPLEGVGPIREGRRGRLDAVGRRRQHRGLGRRRRRLPRRRPVRAAHREDPRPRSARSRPSPCGSSSTPTGTATTPAATRTSAKAGALIVAHDNVRKRMSAEQFIEFCA